MGDLVGVLLRLSDQQGCQISALDHDFGVCNYTSGHGELDGSHVVTIQSSVDTQTRPPVVIPRVTERRSACFSVFSPQLAVMNEYMVF